MTAKNAIRSWFLAQNFDEVETNQLQISPGNETHLLGLSTIFTDPSLEEHELFFATSPEFSCKKLIAAGMKNIFEFARVFRNRDQSKIHSPEFTMLEWYRANMPYEKTIQDTLDICKIAAKSIGSEFYRNKNLEINIEQPAEFITLQEAFLKYANIDLLATISDEGEENRDLFANLCKEQNIKISEDDNWSDIFTKVLVEKIEPNLGKECPTILYEYPLPEGALARKSPNNSKVVERFELYICGVEIANGFGELIDSDEQRKRFEASMQKQKELYGKSYPIDEDLLEALKYMPPTSGVALGFDRLIMLITGANNIEDVNFTPFPIKIGD